MTPLRILASTITALAVVSCANNKGGNYDILHVQNLFPQFSPSIYYAAAKAGVPIVQAVRNYRLVCASANLFRNGRYCSDCVGRVPVPAILHACYRSSRLATASVVGMQTAHKLMGTWHNKVGCYVALTKYVKDRLVEGGYPEKLIKVKPNFVSAVDLPDVSSSAGDYALYVGRLTAEKGAAWLTDVWSRSGINLPLKMVGEGDSKITSQPESSSYGGGHIEFLGRLPSSETYRMMRSAKFLIVPGQWPEPFGRIVIEAYAFGTPVLAARAGGLSELVQHGETGFLFEAGDESSFLAHARTMLDQPHVLHDMGLRARQAYLELYTPEKNYGQILDIYMDLLAGQPGRSTR
ncbi:MAG: glycosyltransferase [Alphaproteobacteria bacterium]|nr:MAG: glycosyltransferase [Alphaproteobacteria bacterium]